MGGIREVCVCGRGKGGVCMWEGVREVCVCGRG